MFRRPFKYIHLFLIVSSGTYSKTTGMEIKNKNQAKDLSMSEEV
ncbi:hypothetical protein QF004_001636 [Chryseobacterium sp. MDT2-18]|nr:hypothetical protein [Chryseobacterium sp. MDT2-18]